jgi:hypothetical protein
MYRNIVAAAAAPGYHGTIEIEGDVGTANLRAAKCDLTACRLPCNQSARGVVWRCRQHRNICDLAGCHNRPRLPHGLRRLIRGVAGSDQAENNTAALPSRNVEGACPRRSWRRESHQPEVVVQGQRRDALLIDVCLQNSDLSRSM